MEGYIVRDYIPSMDENPTHRIGDIYYRPGRVFPFGATLLGNDINFSIYSREAKSVSLLLYHLGEKTPYVTIPLTQEFHIGHVYSVLVFGMNLEDTEYAYQIDGEYDPKRGLLYDPTIPLIDPYAKCISGRPIWGEIPKGGELLPQRAQVIREDYDWEGDVPLQIPFKDLVIYEAHVRGFTVDPSSGVPHPGTFTGLREKIPYLKELGINCVELLPIFAYDEFENPRTFEGKRLYNYWGYSTVGFFAPKAGYASTKVQAMEVEELKALIKALHRNGIEVILDVVYNHTAEGNEMGPTISFRGIDNRTYYLLDNEGRYLNYSGCGNTMNCNNALVRSFVLDSLRYWVSSYHVDGFRFDLASILSRDEAGKPMASPPLLEQLANDPVLGRCKLIAEAWDAGGLYQVGSFPSYGRWSEWNGRYRDCLRTFIKGGAEASVELYQRILGSLDIYGDRGTTASINFVTCHDGFTLHDLFAYMQKHNEANGEENRDGNNQNDSWNCGAEGETSDQEVLSLRRRQMKNAMTILLTSRGVPMILSGDEFGNSQGGNNNSYCQDSPVSWLNWEGLEENQDLYLYVKELIALRMAHPVLRSSFGGFGVYNGTGYPEISFHGTSPWEYSLDRHSLVFGYLYAEDGRKEGTGKDAFLYVCVNAHWEEHSFTLPELPPGREFELLMDSGYGVYPEGERRRVKSLTLGPRSTAVLLG